MVFKYIELIYTPFVYNYLIVCFLFSIIYINTEFPNSTIYLLKKLKLYIFIVFMFSIPLYQWYNISFHGGYYPTHVFILDLFCGLLVFTLFTKVRVLLLKKSKAIILVLCLILIYILTKSIYADTAIIMTYP